MKIKNQYRKMFLIPFLAAVFGLVFFQSARAGTPAEEVLEATHITRITHPAVSADNIWKGETRGNSSGGSGLWNQDYTKMLIYERSECAGCAHPDYLNWVNRGFVWGYTDVLKNIAGTVEYSDSLQNTWNYINDYRGTLEEYAANTYPVPSKYEYASGSEAVPVWSKIPGEKDVFYAIERPSGQNKFIRLWRCDTSIDKYCQGNSEKLVATFNDSQGRVAPSPLLVGWRKSNNNLFITITGDDDTIDNEALGWEINPMIYNQSLNENSPGWFSNGIYKGNSKCSAEGLDRPFIGIHGGRSPDGLYKAGYGWDTGTAECQNYKYKAILQYQDNYWSGLGHMPVHVDWAQKSNNWFITGDPGSGGVENNPMKPNMRTFRVYQSFFDRDYASKNCTEYGKDCTGAFTHNELIKLASAGMWNEFDTPLKVCTEDDEKADDYKGKVCTRYDYKNCVKGYCAHQSWNYNSHIVPTLRNDDRQVMIMSHNGAYSQSDHNKRGVAPYATRGMFLVDLGLKNGTSPADINQDNVVNSADIQLCVNVILETETDPVIIARAKAVAEPLDSCDVLDLQAIVNGILGI